MINTINHKKTVEIICVFNKKFKFYYCWDDYILF